MTDDQIEALNDAQKLVGPSDVPNSKVAAALLQWKSKGIQLGAGLNALGVKEERARLEREAVELYVGGE